MQEQIKPLAKVHRVIVRRKEKKNHLEYSAVSMILVVKKVTQISKADAWRVGNQS